VSELGKSVGYCPHCHIEIGISELGKLCSRCGELIEYPEDELNAFIEINKQSLKQSAMARHYPSSWDIHGKRGVK